MKMRTPMTNTSKTELYGHMLNKMLDLIMALKAEIVQQKIIIGILPDHLRNPYLELLSQENKIRGK